MSMKKFLLDSYTPEQQKAIADELADYEEKKAASSDDFDPLDHAPTPNPEDPLKDVKMDIWYSDDKFRSSVKSALAGKGLAKGLQAESSKAAKLAKEGKVAGKP